MSFLQTYLSVIVSIVYCILSQKRTAKAKALKWNKMLLWLIRVLMGKIMNLK